MVRESVLSARLDDNDEKTKRITGLDSLFNGLVGYSMPKPSL